MVSVCERFMQANATDLFRCDLTPNQLVTQTASPAEVAVGGLCEGHERFLAGSTPSGS